MSTASATMSTTASTASEGYIILENMIRDRVVMRSGGPLFTTSVSPEALWAAYMSGFPEANRKHYDCHSCRRFIQTYGGLVTIGKDGSAKSLLWDGDCGFGDDVPPFFFSSLKAMADLIAAAKVDGVFLSSDKTWGTPTTPDKKRAFSWTHLSAKPARVYEDKLLTASQRMAEKLEDFKMLQRALADYAAPAAEQAVRVLKSDALARSEKALGIAEWFSSLHGKNKNQLWLAVATAPPGFCHVRSTMISTLLDDVVAGLDFAVIARRWSEKMDPLQYQRPSAAPKEGAIEAAEKIVEKLGIAKSLVRRFAKLTDVQVKHWEPKPAAAKKAAKADGVFGHLRGQADAVKEVALPPTTMTWSKFSKTVLPDARSLEIRVPSNGSFFALMTAADAEAPPIFQWDREEQRNPASWYIYKGGSPASQWGLVAGTWTKVTSVYPSPPHWHQPEKSAHHGEGALFALEGAQDSRRDSMALFPECLKSELHGIRSVIEAHSKKGGIQGDGGDANGVYFEKGSPARTEIRVDGSAVYVLDRWD